MSFKNKLKENVIKLTGYFILKKRFLPVGVDLGVDLKYKFNIHVKNIFDVGGNFGQSVLKFNEMFPDSMIYSFEPSSENFQILKENVKNIKNTQLFSFGFGEENSKTTIHQFDGIYSACNSIKHDFAYGIKSVGKENIEIKTIDEVTKELKIESIDLLKIDTEGYEIEVLKGAKNNLQSKAIKAIFLEVALSPKNNRNTSLIDLICFLDIYDYKFVGLHDVDYQLYRENITYANALFVI